MELQPPIYTEKTACQDCYKCVRNCPVKAIKVLQGSATVVQEDCVFCGTCVNVCPMGAKKVRDDGTDARKLLEQDRPVYLSLAPSWISEFPEWEERKLVAAIKQLGFTGVSETALGAEIVSDRVVELLDADPNRLYLSTACPTAVELARKYFPALTENMTLVSSPVIAHCRYLRRLYGNDIRIVFAGPCISKKLEADRHGDIIDCAVTFEDLRDWLETERKIPVLINPGADDRFVPYASADGVLYPVDGGMTESIRIRREAGSHSPPRTTHPHGSSHPEAESQKESGAGSGRIELLSFSGPSAIMPAMQDLQKRSDPGGVFLELLACEGGCVNGPKTGSRMSPVTNRMTVRSLARTREESPSRVPGPDHAASTPGGGVASMPKDVGTEPPVMQPSGSDADVDPQEYHPDRERRQAAGATHRWSGNDIKEALVSIGKYSESDELNCSGCGYDSCRSFAVAILEGKAESTMCVSYMRKLALKKANALIKAMPSGVVISDKSLHVVECNRKFAELMGEDALLAYEANPGLEGAGIKKLVPFADLFTAMIENTPQISENQFHLNNRILSVTLFPVEPGQVVGAIVQDITQPEVQREELIHRVREVTEKNMKTVQRIAYLLGENAAETEIILKSLTDAYAVKPNGVDE